MLTLDDLKRPATEVALAVLGGRLEEVQKQGERLRADPAAEEVLHDMRVAVRRARVWIKLCAPIVHIPRKARCALRDFAHASNPVRDMEVQETWLAALHMPSSLKPGWIALRERLAHEHASRRAALLELLPTTLDGARRAMERMRPCGKTCDTPFGPWLAEQWTEAAQAYLAGLGHLPEGLHPLRLVGKKLRYMLEPQAKALEAEDVLRCLRQGQDALGRVNDAELFASALPAHAAALLAERIEQDMRQALSQGQPPRWQRPAIWPGLRAVSQALLDEQRQALAALDEWRQKSEGSLSEGLSRLGARLASINPDGAPAGEVGRA